MKRTYLLFIWVLTALMMSATQFSQEQARHAAEQYVKQKVGKNALVKEIKALAIEQAPSSAASYDREAMAYAVNLDNNEGFVLVVGNDQSHDILGYCDHGTFNEQQMPPNMRSWLKSYLSCASGVKDVNTAHLLRSAPGIPTKTPIAPLLKCQWNQDSPYNDQCPELNGQHCATGCTNTAMAQVMFYHQWPTGATAAIPGYTPDNSGGTSYPTLPALEPTTFDWIRCILLTKMPKTVPRLPVCLNIWARHHALIMVNQVAQQAIMHCKPLSSILITMLVQAPCGAASAPTKSGSICSMMNLRQSDR